MSLSKVAVLETSSFRKMCKRKFILPKSTIPERRWQYVCLKNIDGGDYKGSGICSLFCSPDGREFQTMAQVREHQRKLKEFHNEKKKKLRLLEARREKEIKLRAELQTKKKKLTESKPSIPLVLKKQMTDTTSNIKTKTKRKTKSKTKKPKEKITTNHLQYFFGMKEYPLILNLRNQKMWENMEVFRNYYMPLVYIVNSTVHVRLLETYMEAKWREVMAWKP